MLIYIYIIVFINFITEPLMKIFIGSYMAQLNHMADYLNQYEWEFVDPPPKLTISAQCVVKYLRNRC